MTDLTQAHARLAGGDIMDNERVVPVSEVREVALAMLKLVIRDIVKDVATRWWKIGFLCGLIVGWIAGGLVMVYFS